MFRLSIGSLVMKNINIRKSHGSSLAELAPALFILFFLFVFPIINLGTLALRYGLLATAARDGAHAAATAYTFESGSTGKPAALNKTPKAVYDLINNYSGITVTFIDVDILVTDINTQAVTRHADKLSQPANTQSNLYSLESIVTAELSPLVPFDMPFLAEVPGLTGPWTTTVRAREYAENSQGLNQ